MTILNIIFTITKKSITDTVENFPDYVQDIMWTASYTEGIYTVTQNGGTSLELVPSDNFINFSNLTDAECIAWVKNSLGEAGILHVENVLLDKLTEIKAADYPRIQLEQLMLRLAALENK